MGRRPLIPPQLRRGPFTLDDARSAGLSPEQLKGDSWERIAPGIYRHAATIADTRLLLAAAALRLPDSAVFSGLTAAWLHGLDVVPAPLEVTLPPGCNVSGRVGIRVRRADLTRAEVGRVGGFRATRPARTIADVARSLPLVEATVVADAALHAGLVSASEVAAWAAGHRGAPGVARLRRVLEAADGQAESPMETRLRLLIVLAGLPRPESQVPIRDRWGRVVGRPDLLYRRERLAIEYDGGVHRDTLVADNRRQNRLVALGYRLLRFTAGDVLEHRDAVVAQVAAELRRAA